MPPALTGREEEDIVETGIRRVAIVEGLERIGLISLMKGNITWASGFGVLVSRDNDCDLIDNREVMASFVPDAA